MKGKPIFPLGRFGSEAQELWYRRNTTQQRETRKTESIKPQRKKSSIVDEAVGTYV